jgi:cell division septation protein DedD
MIIFISGSCEVQRTVGAYKPAKKSSTKTTATVAKPAKTVEVTEGVEVTKSSVEEEENAQPKETVEATKPAVAANYRTESYSIVEDDGAAELKTYHVVIGSFGKQENARALQQKMRPAYSPVIVVNESGMFRVLLISYDDYASAKQKISEIFDQFSDAWILVQKQ